MVCSTAASALAAKRAQGASFLRFDGTPWSTDKDGIIMCLLAAEITAVTGKNPQEHYNELAKRFGAPSYNRLQAAATSAQKAALSKLSPEMVSASTRQVTRSLRA